MLHIRELSGSFYLYDGDKMVRMYHEFAVCYSCDTQDGRSLYTLHKYGEKDSVETWMMDAKSRFVAAGYPEMAASLAMIAEGPFRRWNEEDLSRLISTSGYIKTFVEEDLLRKDAIDV